jgi:hypothetical protein
MTNHIELKRVSQGTALATRTLALPALVIEELEEFKGSFDRLCLQAGTAAIEAMLAADAKATASARAMAADHILDRAYGRPPAVHQHDRGWIIPPRGRHDRRRAGGHH